MLDVEIIVVDTGSSDGSVNIAKRCADKVIINPRTTRGAARNVGEKIAKNQALAFVDSDCEITEKWILGVCNLSNDLNSRVLGGPPILDVPHNTMGKAIRDLLSIPLFTFNSSSFSMTKKRKRVKNLPAANILISKDFFEKIKGFPDLQFNEDTLFCRKVLENNGKIIYDPEFQVIHKHYFSDIKSFIRYFFKYGEEYAKTFKKHPFLVRRYAIVAFLSLAALISAFGSALKYSMLSIYFLSLIILAYLIGTLLYSLVKIRKAYAVFFPIIFTLLIMSYVSGFYCGMFRGSMFPKY